MESKVQEVPGIYGSVKIDEVILQRIWAEQDFFMDNLYSACGKKIKVLDRGNWNRSEEGPDFKNAKLLIDGNQIGGDIEIHLQPSDWETHGHDTDLNYNNVVLHVCIFSNPSPDRLEDARKMNGFSVPTLFLLPCLYCGLEEYAEFHAINQLSGRDRLDQINSEKICNLSSEAIEHHTLKRWESKLRFAKIRLSKQGWSNTCHQWFLEVLGYRRNRAPMARISQKFSFLDWKSGVVEPETALLSQKDWKFRGCRPANHPRVRLTQYAKLWSINANWIDALEKILEELPKESKGGEVHRKEILKFSKFWRYTLLGGIFSESKANTLLIDFALPLLSAKKGTDLYELWRDWPSGDCPQVYREWAKMNNWTNRNSRKPLTNGMVQCMISATSF